MCMSYVVYAIHKSIPHIMSIYAVLRQKVENEIFIKMFKLSFD